MKTTKLISMTLAIGLTALTVGSAQARENNHADETAITEAATSIVVLQFLEMRDARTQERLYYRVSEVAGRAGLSTAGVTASIEEGKLCAIIVDGVPLVAANYAQGYLAQVGKRATVATTSEPN